jgi:hypothetical protein
MTAGHQTSSTVTAEMVERAWAAIVGTDVAPICFQASIIRADLRTALEAVIPAQRAPWREAAFNAVSEILCGKTICTDPGDWLCPPDIDCANEMIAEIVAKVEALASPIDHAHRQPGWADQNHQIDRYGVALMMIREGYADPAGLARRILGEFGSALPSTDDKSPAPPEARYIKRDREFIERGLSEASNSADPVLAADARRALDAFLGAKP